MAEQKQDTTWISRRLSGEGAPLIIDGGMGTELEKSGVPMNGACWSGMAVLDAPDMVRHVHEAFIRAGAEVIIANTFSSGRHMLDPAGHGDQVATINHNAVQLAREARDNAAGKPVAIAGSICEWAAAESSEWATPKAVAQTSREQALLLAEAGVDIIALEMCERPEYSTRVVESALETGLPVWVGVSAMRHKGCDHLSVFDDATRHFDDLVQALAGYPVQALNIMHTPVPDVDAALDIVQKYWPGPVGVYPESGYFIMPNWQFVDVISPDDLALAARGWVDRRVRLIGGCCGLGPDHVKALSTAFT
ncbi:MAG: homocysteine S-methyltransferase family protein [Alphaproteobacteria bacterium]|nr:homocysteine S-methyltransferase family protein [Alphaproteobacteria bacterium]